MMMGAGAMSEVPSSMIPAYPPHLSAPSTSTTLGIQPAGYVAPHFMDVQPLSAPSPAPSEKSATAPPKAGPSRTRRGGGGRARKQAEPVEEVPLPEGMTKDDLIPKVYYDEETGDQIYPCPQCPKKYSGKHARSIWRRHLQDKHNIPLAQQPRRTRWDNGA